MLQERNRPARVHISGHVPSSNTKFLRAFLHFNNFLLKTDDRVQKGVDWVFRRVPDGKEEFCAKVVLSASVVAPFAALLKEEKVIGKILAHPYESTALASVIGLCLVGVSKMLTFVIKNMEKSEIAKLGFSYIKGTVVASLVFGIAAEIGTNVLLGASVQNPFGLPLISLMSGTLIALYIVSTRTIARATKNVKQMDSVLLAHPDSG